MGTYANHGQEADDLIAEQGQVIISLNQENAALHSEVQAQAERADVAEEKYRVHMLEHLPPVPVSWTRVGSSLQAGKGDYEAYATRCGGLECNRTFSPPGKMPTSLAAAGVATDEGKRLIVHSFKGRSADITTSCNSLASGADDVWVNSFLDSKKPDTELYVIWRHEPDEENVVIKSWNDAQWRMRKLVDAANVRGFAKGPGFKKILFGANLMTWSVQMVPARIANMYPGEGCWDFISWDGYTGKSGQPFETGENMFKEAIAWNKTHGNLPFAIGEFGGSHKYSTDRAQLIKSVCDYAKANGALFVSYWNADLGDNNYTLTPADEKVLGAQSK